MIDRQRSDVEVDVIVEAAQSKAALLPHPSLEEIAALIDNDIDYQIMRARAYTRLGYDVTGDEFVRALAIRYEASRVLYRVIEARKAKVPARR